MPGLFSRTYAAGHPPQRTRRYSFCQAKKPLDAHAASEGHLLGAWRTTARFHLCPSQRIRRDPSTIILSQLRLNVKPLRQFDRCSSMGCEHFCACQREGDAHDPRFQVRHYSNSSSLRSG